MTDLLMQPKDTTRLHWVDFLRVLATFLVVLAHVDLWGSPPRQAQLFYYVLSRVGVPFFFMISGYLLLGKQEGVGEFLKKRAWKILVPFLAWSVLYDVFWNQSFVSTGFTLEAVLKMFIRILRGPRAGHLWFFYPLIGLYLFTPILRLFVAKAKQSDLYYFIGLWSFAVPVLYILNEFTPLKVGFDLQFATGYVGYFLLGLVFGRLELTPRLLWSAICIFLTSFVFTYAVHYFNLPPQNNETVFRSYPSLNVVLMSVAAFLLVRVAGGRITSRFVPALTLFSQTSFGIYLVHLFVMNWAALGWKALGFSTEVGPSALVIPLVALAVFLISFLITYILRKIPLVCSIVP